MRKYYEQPLYERFLRDIESECFNGVSLISGCNRGAMVNNGSSSRLRELLSELGSVENDLEKVFDDLHFSIDIISRK